MPKGKVYDDEWYTDPFILEFIHFCYQKPMNKIIWMHAYTEFKNEYDRIKRIGTKCYISRKN